MSESKGQKHATFTSGKDIPLIFHLKKSKCLFSHILINVCLAYWPMGEKKNTIINDHFFDYW